MYDAPFSPPSFQEAVMPVDRVVASQGLGIKRRHKSAQTGTEFLASASSSPPTHAFSGRSLVCTSNAGAESDGAIVEDRGGLR